MLTGHEDGVVYVEDRGWTDNSASGGINAKVLTRDIYPAGIGWEFTLERLWVRHYLHSENGGVTTVTITPYWRNTESDYEQPGTEGNEWTVKTYTTTEGDIFDDNGASAAFGNLFRGGVLSRLDIHLIGESVVFFFEADDNNEGLGMSYMSMEVAGHGLEEKR
jgi:hypothetical protein